MILELPEKCPICNFCSDINLREKYIFNCHKCECFFMNNDHADDNIYLRYSTKNELINYRITCFPDSNCTLLAYDNPHKIISFNKYLLPKSLKYSDLKRLIDKLLIYNTFS